MQFVYQGKTRANKPIKGVIEAKDEVEARLLLREQQIRPTSLSKKGGMSLDMDLGEILVNIPGLEPSVKIKDMVIFTRQFSVMIDSGIPQVMALDILSKQTENATLRKALVDIKERVEQGNSLHAGFSRHPKIFNQLFQNLVAAGEAGGVLDVIFRRLADYMEKNAALIAKVKSALIYPVAVIIIAVVVVWGLLTFVVPKFAEFISQSGGEMPTPTKLLIEASNLFRDNVWEFLFLALGVVFLLRFLFTNPGSRRVIDKYSLITPLIGPLVKKSAVARFCRTMGILIQSGVPILDALDICSRISGNYSVEKALSEARVAISEGKPMTTPLENSSIFPPMVVQMVGVGEKTGALDQMLIKVADFYDTEVDDSVKSMTTMIEPLLMVVLGTIVGGILICLYLPIFKLAGSVGGN